MRIRAKREQGDTLVEVIMNSSLSRVEVSLERTQVQAAMQGQASILRALRDAAIKEYSQDALPQWKTVMTYARPQNPTAEAAVCTDGGFGGTRFYFKPDSTVDTRSWLQAQTTPLSMLPVGTDILPAPGAGIWIEAYKGMDGGSLPYYDFYIKSCWENIGSGPKQELKTVVRLYGDL